MAVVLIKLVPKSTKSNSIQAATTATPTTSAASPSGPVNEDVKIPGVYSTVKKENETFNRLLWAGVGSVATLLLVAVFGKSKN